jgi:hypothetical protein
LKIVGAAEDRLDAGPILSSPEELNTFYSIDAVVDLPPTNVLQLTSNQSDSFVFRTVSFSEVKDALRSIGSDAVGLDEVPLKFVKLFFAFDTVTVEAFI